jgi:hypothetical protein
MTLSSDSTNLKEATKRIKIRFAANGDGDLECVGFSTFECLGRSNADCRYPVDLTVRGEIGVDKFLTKFSNEFQVDMPHAILIWGQRGIYIHEWPGRARRAVYGQMTAGCIHLSPSDALSVYDWINGPTRVTIEYPW